jgi:endonuclease/exonuclease/phosphatase family metal-dependent hydrolase
MKIIYLNAWNGRVRDEITEYIKAQIPTTDIFCFQEAYDDMKSLCTELLQGYAPYMVRKTLDEINDFSQVTYVRKGIPVTGSGSILMDEADCGLGLYVEVGLEEERVSICNFHGISRPVDKLDSSKRLLQSETLIRLFDSKGYVVIGGDFNLFPETKSIGMFEEKGYVDLIKKFDIKNTRNHFVWDRYPDTKQYYSDYVFMSPSVMLQSFTVPENEISDHLPLEVTI